MPINPLSEPNHRSADRARLGDYLDTDVRNVMTAGVITIPADAWLRDVQRTLVTHRIHSVLVVEHTSGRPVGWATARGLLSWLFRDQPMCAGDAVTHEPASIQPSATVRKGLTALQQPGVSQLLVSRLPGIPPEGVFSDLDVIALAASSPTPRPMPA